MPRRRSAHEYLAFHRSCLADVLGGKFVAPLIGAGGAVNPDDFNPFPLFMALASAAAILISSMIHKRFSF